jgi:hypothetical protein
MMVPRRNNRVPHVNIGVLASPTPGWAHVISLQESQHPLTLSDTPKVRVNITLETLFEGRPQVWRPHRARSGGCPPPGSGRQEHESVGPMSEVPRFRGARLTTWQRMVTVTSARYGMNRCSLVPQDRREHERMSLPLDTFSSDLQRRRSCRERMDRVISDDSPRTGKICIPLHHKSQRKVRYPAQHQVFPHIASGSKCH